MRSLSLCRINWIREDVIFFSEHGPFPAYLKRFHRSDSDQCTCGGTGTALHYATECTLTVSWHIRRPEQWRSVPGVRMPRAPVLRGALDSKHYSVYSIFKAKYDEGA
ncbi:hypothetical protein AVEN_143780-1 [Araneus ventricosus]|uniref:Uncharacterized protein n=1 Tax=Araneus ventricosus TaxID=182803 RepID=A0A4Y2AP69_ARAVE|nr:hypothetical protein AVEN_143780-1 [Araneus ventricosus]